MNVLIKTIFTVVLCLLVSTSCHSKGKKELADEIYTLALNKKFAEALILAEEGTKRFPSEPFFLNFQGFMLRALNRDSEAKAVYIKVSSSPGPAMQRSYALQQIAYIDLLQGNTASAEENALKADQLDASTSSKAYLARIEMVKKNYSKAIQLFQNAIDLLSKTYPSRNDVRQRTKLSIENSIAICYMFLGELQKSKSMIENIQKADSDLTFEEYYAMIGDAKTAAAELEKKLMKSEPAARPTILRETESDINHYFSKVHDSPLWQAVLLKYNQ